MQKMFIMKICCVPRPQKRIRFPALGPFAMKITDQPHRKEPDVNLLSAGNFFQGPHSFQGSKILRAPLFASALQPLPQQCL